MDLGSLNAAAAAPKRGGRESTRHFLQFRECIAEGEAARGWDEEEEEEEVLQKSNQIELLARPLVDT